MHDILRCPKCTDGYLIVKKNPKNDDIFYGFTNYFNERKMHKHGAIENGLPPRQGRWTMKQTSFNKLVCDHLPEIIGLSRKTCTIETLSGENVIE